MTTECLRCATPTLRASDWCESCAAEAAEALRSYLYDRGLDLDCDAVVGRAVLDCDTTAALDSLGLLVPDDDEHSGPATFMRVWADEELVRTAVKAVHASMGGVS